MTAESAETKKVAGEKNRGMAVLAYVLFFLPLLTEAKEDPYVKFHVKQSLTVLIAGVAVSVVGSIIPFLGWLLILPFGSLLVMVLWVMGVINALNGVKKEVPLIGKYADQYLKF
jgi:uncharacterized membrane protein